ncbi:uncharacterized protein FA14DRAFT_162387 [Meira miltonrushii]|uniref:Exoribonuclease phosphorolytic domain-containing protein n=1 Tax=Meira miltonrushii TaxID=1280837 RepID=A0A316V3X4_9BASI|nr:uncharacterized protein FA14DRAFT_162387 [Meira miltonrushii]PWN32152.1 hypothetical protein FA14DRAFT_162387 [Meira miltonrushii]
MAKKERGSLDLRPIKIEQGLLGHQDGSALFSFGPVSALAAVSGPSEVRIRDERTDRSALQIHFTPLQGIAGTSATTFESTLQGIWQNTLQLHLYPRSLVQIHLQTYASPPQLVSHPLLHPDQRTPIDQPPIQPPHPDAPISVSLRAAHINATTLACLDGSIPMRSMVAACSAVVIRKGIRSNLMRGWRAGETNPTEQETQSDSDHFEILLDPTPYEESLAKSSHVFAFAFEKLANQSDFHSGLIYNDSQGTQSGADYLNCLSLCREASQNIVKLMRDTMARRLLGAQEEKGDTSMDA